MAGFSWNPYTNVRRSLGSTVSMLGTATAGGDPRDTGLSEAISGAPSPVIPRAPQTIPQQLPGYTGSTFTEAAPITNQDQTYAGDSGGTTDPNALSADERAYLDSNEGVIRGYLNELQGGLDQGRAGLSDSYNRELGDAKEGRGRTVRDFNVQERGLERGRGEAIGQVNSNARTLSNSVRRILGMAGGNGSSAYQIAAPDAVARKAFGERTNVLENYGQNFMNLDNAKKDSESDFDRHLRDLELQRNERSLELGQGIASQRSSLYQQLAEVQGKRAQGGGYNAIRAAQAPSLQAAQASRQAGQGLFDKYRTPVNSVKDVEVKTPSLSDYLVDRAAINANRGSSNLAYSPYQVRKKEEEK